MQDTDFTRLVSHFQAISPEEGQQLLEEKKGATLFIGRETCSYCQRFVPKLAAVAAKQPQPVYFLNSLVASPALTALRERYTVPTVPALLYAAPDGVRVRCDSSMTEEEILHFVTA